MPDIHIASTCHLIRGETTAAEEVGSSWKFLLYRRGQLCENENQKWHLFSTLGKHVRIVRSQQCYVSIITVLEEDSKYIMAKTFLYIVPVSDWLLRSSFILNNYILIQLFNEFFFAFAPRLQGFNILWYQLKPL